jgi:hypothetical protein
VRAPLETGARLALVTLLLGARVAVAQPKPAPPPAAAPASVPAPPAADPAADGLDGLQSEAQVSTRNSAYSLASGTFGIDAGVLGFGGGEVFAKLGVAYGFGAGFQAEINLAHSGVGLVNAGARWHFLDTRYVDVGARVGVWYGHGKWLWFVQGVTKEIVSKIDVLNVPVEVTASSQLTRWLELDLGVEYVYAEVFGSVGDEDSIFTDARLGMQRLIVRPGARLFLSDNTAFELFADLPAFTRVPRDRGDVSVPFSDTWLLDVGLRSRFVDGVFGSVRLHYGEVAKSLYGARLSPSVGVEFRF